MVSLRSWLIETISTKLNMRFFTHDKVCKNRFYTRRFSVMGMRIKTVILFFTLFTMFSSSFAQNKIKIGILAYRGKEACLTDWKSTAEYLNNKIPEYHFVIIPLSFDEINESVKNGKVNFLVTNPAIYAELEYLYGIDRIATSQKTWNNKPIDKFGGVIFTLKSRKDINVLKDLKNKSIAAVHSTSYGGWICQWREFYHNDINPYKDFSKLEFLNTQDNTVYQVLNKKSDVGCVRTGILEKMDLEGKINLSDFKILNQQKYTDYNLCASTELYPEWPFANLKHTSSELAKKVVVALLTMPKNCKANNDDCTGWTIPEDYQSVHNCLKELHIKPYHIQKEITIGQIIQKYYIWIILGTLGLSILLFILFYIIRLNKKIKTKSLEIEKSHKFLETKVKERTEELRKKNKSLAIQIKEREKAEQAIQKLSLVVEQNSNLIFITDVNGVFEYVNPAFIQATGYTFNELKGKTPNVLKSGNTSKEEYDNLWETLKKGEIWKGEFLNKRKNGQLFYESASIFPLKNTEGEVINFVAIMEDITQKKKALDALKESENRFKLLFNSLGDAVFVTGIDTRNSGRIFEANPAAEKQTGYSHDELLTKNIIKDLTIKGTSKLMTEYREEKLKKGDTLLFVEKKRRKDGSEFWTEVIISPFKYKGKEASLSINRDISERKKVEEELLIALKKATESDRLKKAFLQNISHEIRTPMNGILSFSELLKTPNLDKESAEAIFDLLAVSGRRMINTLDDLMTIAMAETGSLKLNKTIFMLDQEIAEVIASIKPDMESKNLYFNYVSSPEITNLHINTDLKKFKTILKNLINNAIKFTPQGSILLEVTTSKRTLTNEGISIEIPHILICVTDTGIGIPEDKQKAIFERFIQADIEDKNAYQGSGLGLAISKIYVEMLGGKIWFESEEGLGSVFYVSLPSTH